MIKISSKIFNYSKPILIAEISGNHGGSKKRFIKLINSAYNNGADIVKIQTYEPSDITIKKKNHNFKIKSGTWKNKYLWELYKKAQTPYKWHHDAFKIAKKRKKIIFSSPFSIKAVDFLESLNVPLYKIASFEITDINLINYIASKKKPIIISTGMSTLNEIRRAIKEINKFHNKIIIMHCVSSYPTNLEDTSLNKINFLKKKFKKNFIGLSDHTDDIISSAISMPIGVVAIEKHFKLNNKFKSEDSSFSITPDKLRKLRIIIDKISLSLNSNSNNFKDIINKKLRRSIFARINIKKNEIISKKKIISLRPKIGICSSKYYEIIGKKLKKNIKKNDPIYFKDLK